MTLQGGIFSSLIGYDGLYAKDNFTYTRPWTGDYTPYFMLGVNASYPVTPRLTATALLVNGYWHLAHANDVPSVGGLLAYKATDRVTVKETVLMRTTSDRHRAAVLAILFGQYRRTKNRACDGGIRIPDWDRGRGHGGDPRALWMAAQAPVKWSIRGPWSVVVRPEFAWDRDGRWIGAPQSITAFTSTVDDRRSFGEAQAIVRLEYRVDDSRGSGGGFLPSRM